MPVSYSTPDKFDSKKGYTRVIYGYDAPLMDTELNEMQKIFADRFATLTKAIASNGFVSLPAMSLSAGTFTLGVDSFLLNGIVFQMFEPMTISASSGDTLYLAVWEQTIAFGDSIKQGGNQSGGSAIADNGIWDSRAAEETTRRVQLQMQLVKSNADSSKQYLSIATLTSATVFTDNRQKAQMSISLAANLVDTVNLKDSSVSDSKIGDRTIVDSTAPTGNTGPISTLLNGLANMVKAITGKSDWRTAPRTTLENAVKLNGDTMTGPLTVNSRIGAFNATGRDIAVGDWGDASSNTAGTFMLGNNAYLVDGSLYKYTNNHASLGARGIVFTQGQGAAFFDTGATATTQDATFAPTLNTIWHAGNHNTSGDPHTQYALKTLIGAASGIASLGSDGKVPSAQLPALNYVPTSQVGAASGVASLGSDGKVPSAQLPALNYVPTSQVGAASGVASLGSDGKVPSGQLPSLNYLPLAGGALSGTLTVNAATNFISYFRITNDVNGAWLQATNGYGGGTASSNLNLSGYNGAATTINAIGTLNANANAASRLILPVGTDKYAT